MFTYHSSNSKEWMKTIKKWIFFRGQNKNVYGLDFVDQPKQIQSKEILNK